MFYNWIKLERKLQILGYAHNQGMGGAENWITTGVVGSDGFGTKGTKYTDLILILRTEIWCRFKISSGSADVYTP